MHRREGEHSDIASKRVQSHSASQFASAIAPQEREQVDAKYTTDCIQECREATGGKGYLAENRFADLKADLVRALDRIHADRT